MILYNITTKVEHRIHDRWLTFMQRDWIPLVMETGLFEEFKLSRLRGVEESDGLTYALQLVCPNKPSFDLYMEQHAHGMQHMHHEAFKGQYVIFRSFMDVIDSGRA